MISQADVCQIAILWTNVKKNILDYANISNDTKYYIGEKCVFITSTFYSETYKKNVLYTSVLDIYDNGDVISDCEEFLYEDAPYLNTLTHNTPIGVYKNNTFHLSVCKKNYDLVCEMVGNIDNIVMWKY